MEACSREQAVSYPAGQKVAERMPTRPKSRPHSQGHTPLHLFIFSYFATFLGPLPDCSSVFPVKYEQLKHTRICKPALHLLSAPHNTKPTRG